MRRELAFGIVVSAGLVWLMFFATPGTVVVATLAAAVLALIWFSTVETARLRDDAGRPHVMLFGLTLVAGALVVTAAVFISTPTVFLVGLVVISAGVVGLVRAIRAAMGAS